MPEKNTPPKTENSSGPKTLLALDTATKTASVALLNMASPKAELLARRDAPVRTHGKALVPLIVDLFKEARMEPGDLAALGCGAGPGSFTGVRVGLATAKGLCLPKDLPLAMISSLDALACRLNAPLVAPCLDARRGEVYVALVSMEEPFHPRAVMEPKALAPKKALETLHAAAQKHSENLPEDSQMSIHLLGTGVPLIQENDQCQEFLGETSPFETHPEIDPWPDAYALGKLALRKIRQNLQDDLAWAQPIYLRPSDAEQNFNLDLSPKSPESH